MKIAVAGLGYVGLSNALLLAQHNEVVAIDIDKNKIKLVNDRKPPIVDTCIENFLKNKPLNLNATSNKYIAYTTADIVIVATPTNYDPKTNRFDTASVESVIQDIIEINPDATIIIKSTVPVGYTESLKRNRRAKNVIFSPEFLREGHALRDNLYPSRIVVGEISKRAELFSSLLAQGAAKKDIEILLTNSTEAEAIKLFSNAYLAMRVGFFNELDTYAKTMGLNTKQIINGICSDSRIGNNYNNPSFGYGGYCLPKDTKQLLANFENIPQNLIGAIVDTNETRKRFIAEDILAKKPKKIGIYRLLMKTGSDNFRDSAIQGVMEYLRNSGAEVVVYEPLLENNTFHNYSVLTDLNKFKKTCDIIVANRNDRSLDDVQAKKYTRDIFQIDE